MTDLNIENAEGVTIERLAATAPAINMPDHAVRLTWGYQLFVRLARPTLDWLTNAAFAWTMILQPWLFNRFDVVAAGLALAWAAAVYGIKTWEKKAGVA